ncbi:protein of unknown function [Muriicola jejuensis]|uniref:DUF4271 domain-containing protein n=1 Tax=Muriicola jejuensis TaxID=504488 RepID=A0A6P0UEI3_9FLAO|nr:DUF4271 domain-containing protein [Muriicola jejuensis]NER10289.1 DUF4271 domain-containing protein [Muriicola jejuensis]SMP01403.1 protein of unknown function [Muriicola jejuensis]
MEPVLRQIGQTDWITVIIFASAVFLVLAKALFYSRFLNFVILPFNSKYVFLYNKKDKLVNGFNLLFGIFLLLNFSLFLYYGVDFYLPEGMISSLLLYSVILIFLVLFLFGKLLTQLGSGTIFNSRAVISEIVFKKITYLNYSGLVMFLMNLLLTYVFAGSKEIYLLGSILVVIVLIIGWATIIKTHLKFVTSYFFYFILYLCALEIAPLIIILNTLNV